MPKQFLTPRITGDRFSDGAIPLEVLADFSVLSEMVLEVAKWKFREDHPSRKRAPRGFSEGISLKLTSIEDGSVIPVISLFVSVSTLFPINAEHYFEEARSAIVAAVSAAENGDRITKHLPEKLLGYFDRFGRNLAEGEAIEISNGPGEPIARLTKESRRKLVLASSAKDYSEELSVYGVVHEFDQRAKTCQLTQPTGSIVSKIPVEAQHYDTILDASNGFRDGLRIRIFGVGRFDLSGRLLELESVESVTPLDPLDIGVRIDELKQLKSGWLDGKGKQLPAEQLTWIADSFAKFYPDDAKLPYLFPTPEGNVLAEWSLGKHAVSLEFDLDSHIGHWHTLNLETDEEESFQYELNQWEDWQSIAGKVKALGGEIE